MQTWREPVYLRRSIRQLQIGSSLEYLWGSASDSQARGSCEGTRESGRRRGHPQGSERGLLQFHGPVGCI